MLTMRHLTFMFIMLVKQRNLKLKLLRLSMAHYPLAQEGW